MREKQCKYVNVFVYSFYLFFFSSLLFFPPFANETTMVRHMWSLFAWTRYGFWAICWGHSLEQCHPESERDVHRNLWHHGQQEMVSYRLGALICSFQTLSSAVTLLMQVLVWHGKATAPQNSQQIKEKSHQVSHIDFCYPAVFIIFFSVLKNRSAKNFSIPRASYNTGSETSMASKQFDRSPTIVATTRNPFCRALAPSDRGSFLWEVHSNKILGAQSDR